MDQEHRQIAYRGLDAAFGAVETQMRIVHELRLLRHATLQARRASMESRIVIVLTILVGGVPALYAILPESQQNVWPWALGIVAVIYLCYLVISLIGGRTDEDALKRFEAKYVPTRPEHTPEFILMRIGASGTRLAVLNDILRNETDSQVRARFEAARSHWQGVLDRIDDEAKKLQQLGALSPEDMQRINEWLTRTRG